MAEQRYRVIDRLEAGGMAEVFRGEALSVQGFKKQVAIKRVLPHLAQNKSFIRMFLDEARLGARLNHANIVTVFDIGAADNTYFIVMEFVDGANLKTVLETLKKRGQRIGVKETLHIAMEVCKGLSYAHELHGEDGKPLNIVHRDISPPNILITRGGEVKVTDFGLAKATTQLEKTDPGVVKGKFSYLSPEAALGQEVDARADLFAVGIVMWEALSGQRLFLGDSDYDTVKNVQRAEVPRLRTLNPHIDDALEELLRKAMSRDRDERFRSARDMGDAIADYLFSQKMKVTSYDVGHLIESVVREGALERKARLRDSSIIDELIREELLAFTSLDEMNDPLDPSSGSIRPASMDPPPGAGARPLDAGSFNERMENPAEWFSDDELDQPTAFFDRQSFEPALLDAQKPSDGGLAALLEREDESGRPPPMVSNVGALLEDELRDRVPSGPIDVSDLSELRTARNAPVQPHAPGERPTSADSGALKYVVLAVVILLSAGAAAWFGKLIPH